MLSFLKCKQVKGFREVFKKILRDMKMKFYIGTLKYFYYMMSYFLKYKGQDLCHI